MIYISLGLIIFGIFLLFLGYILVPLNKNVPKGKNENKKFCILIPARDESRVIEELLISIENQTLKVSNKDVYVIVEDKNDKTNSIVKRHGMNIVFRKDLTKRRKGYALDDAVGEILSKKKKYGAYFIFDADNILDKDFIKEMSSIVEEGYDIGIGYRNTKNGENLVSSASALTFSMINTLGNKRKSLYSNNVTISGTGYYIKGSVIEKWGGFPFHTLTEDYELTLYATLHNLTTKYHTKAIFYDEQPNDFKVSIVQRTRWVKGYFQARGKYLKSLGKSIFQKDNNFASRINAFIGVRPYIYCIVGILLLGIDSFFKYSILHACKIIVGMLFLVYFILVLISYSLVQKEKESLNIEVSKVALVFYNPFFLISFVHCAIMALLHRNLEWKRIGHDKTKSKKS